MKYFVIVLVLVGCTALLFPHSFAISENFYSFGSTTNPIFSISSLDYGNLKKDTITAAISNGEITKFDFSAESVIIQVSMQDDGLLYVNIPKNIMYLADHNCNSDAFLLVDGEEVLNAYDSFADPDLKFSDALIYDRNIKSWATELTKDSKVAEIVFAFIIPDAAYSYAFGQRCLMLENGEFMKPLVQKNLGLELHQILCKDNFALTYKKEPRPACVTDETFIKLFERGWQTRLFLPQHLDLSKAGQVNYNIVGDAKILHIVNDPNSGITKILMDTKKKSNLIMALERDFTGIEFQEDRLGYSIFVDGKKTAFKEPWGKNNYRTNFQLNIPPSTEKIEIIPSISN